MLRKPYGDEKKLQTDWMVRLGEGLEQMKVLSSTGMAPKLDQNASWPETKLLESLDELVIAGLNLNNCPVPMEWRYQAETQGSTRC